MPDTDTAPTNYGRLGVAMCHALAQAGHLTFQCTQGEAQRPLEQFLTSLRIAGFEVVLQPILPVNAKAADPVERDIPLPDDYLAKRAIDLTASPELLGNMFNVSPDAVRRAAVSGSDMLLDGVYVRYPQEPGQEKCEGDDSIKVVPFIVNLFDNTDRLAQERFNQLFDRNVSPYAADHQFTIGDETMARVFKRNGIKNMYDIQVVLDAVEAALVDAIQGDTSERMTITVNGQDLVCRAIEPGKLLEALRSAGAGIPRNASR